MQYLTSTQRKELPTKRYPIRNPFTEADKAALRDQWLWAVAERSGKCVAAVALANKNLRSARARLIENTEYQRYPLAA